jgi:hypothetical protein
VCLGKEWHDDVPEYRVTWVEDRDPQLLRVDGVGEESAEGRVLGLGTGRGSDPIERLPSDADVSRKTPGRARLEGAPSSCSSVVTIVATFGQCFSVSSEKNAAPGISIKSVSGQVSRMVRVIASGSGPVGSDSSVMA